VLAPEFALPEPATMRFLLTLLCFAWIAVPAALAEGTRDIQIGPGSSQSDRRLARAFEERLGGFQILFSGTVVRNFRDSPHQHVMQQLIVQLASGQTLLVVHDKTIGRGVPRVRIGNKVTVLGEYRWNPKGGYIMFTTRKADGSQGGWIRRGGRKYE
jgi:hypothetical protein